jgi:hypothetical protein
MAAVQSEPWIRALITTTTTTTTTNNNNNNPLFFSDFSENLLFSSGFAKILKYRVSRKSD